jgi:hypothetical protein
MNLTRRQLIASSAAFLAVPAAVVQEGSATPDFEQDLAMRDKIEAIALDILSKPQFANYLPEVDENGRLVIRWISIHGPLP